MGQQPIKNIVNYEKYFSKELTDLLTYINEDYLQTFPMNEITTEMFFSAAFSVDNCMLYKLFDTFLNSIAMATIQTKLSSILQEQAITAIKPGRKIEYSKELKNLFNRSLIECQSNGSLLITSDYVLLSLLSMENGAECTRVKKIFNEQGINYAVALERSRKIHELTDAIDSMDNNDEDEEPSTMDIEIQPIDTGDMFGMTPIAIQITGDPRDFKFSDITNMFNNMMGIPPQVQEQQQKTRRSKDKSKNTVQYCTNLNEEAKNGNIDSLIGRDNEINRIVKTLNRRNSNNVLLVGESGCGKTAIVKGLAKRIVDGLAPSVIADYTILNFNTADLIAGTQLRGMLEARMTTLYKEIKKRENTILFIDDFHSFFNDRKDDDYNILAMLLPFLDDKDCKVIAATTYKGYKNSIEKKQAIANRFNKIDIEEPTMEECKTILQTSKKLYEKYHNVMISNEIIDAVLSLCKKYESKKSIISAALDVIDELGAKKRIDNVDTDEIKNKRQELEEMMDHGDPALVNDIKLQLVKLINTKDDFDVVQEVTLDDLYATFADYENIPISKLNVSEKQQISNIDKTLKSVIIGQDEAIDVVSRAIKRSKVGLSSHTKPLATFLCVGKTGVGKTLLAKMLAKEIYCNEKNLVRFDMSEYADKTSVNKLIGSSAGYVGYEEGGLLTEAIKTKKHCVLLFDEIEKADEEVYNLFLQIFDEGFLTDNMGHRVDFRDTIILLTSNVGTKLASEARTFGFDKDDSQTQKDVIEKELKRKFPPEFINRLDSVVYFNALTDDNLRQIIELELNKLNDRIQDTKYSITWDPGTVNFLLNSISNEKEYGARPIMRAIQENIENKITDMILENEYLEGGHVFTIRYNDEIKKLMIE